MGIKYYYSAPSQLRMGMFLADADGKMIYQFPDSKFIKNIPRVTICSILDGDKLSFGFATCSPKDQYVKKFGRHIAYERAVKKPYKVCDVKDVEAIHEATDRVITEIFDLESARIFNVSN